MPWAVAGAVVGAVATSQASKKQAAGQKKATEDAKSDSKKGYRKPRDTMGDPYKHPSYDSSFNWGAWASVIVFFVIAISVASALRVDMGLCDKVYPIDRLVDTKMFCEVKSK